MALVPAEFKAWIGDRVSDPVTAIPLLEALSSLEFAGAKMILRSENPASPAHLAHHAFEEVIHGQIILAVARGLYPKVPTARLAAVIGAAADCVAATDGYAKRLMLAATHAIGRALPRDARKTAYYNVISYLIEVRLMLVFPAIAAQAPDRAVAAMAERIIADEKGHLGYVTQPSREISCDGRLDLDALSEAENRLAEAWRDAIEARLCGLAG